ncbi:MAG: cytochrome c biogenesis protein CcdA [Patescibacteria group bacterium]
MDNPSTLWAFVAGVLMFLAPCTLPLLPAYLGFISGASASDFADPKLRKSIRLRVLWNGFLYGLGFAVVFITLGLLVGVVGGALVPWRKVLIRLGGAFVIFFGLSMVIPSAPFFRGLQSERRFRFASLRPGGALASFLFGASFALGWTPCVGPILGGVLTFAATTANPLEGAYYLAIFSLGLGLPFMIVAFFFGSAAQYIAHFEKYLRRVSYAGGVLLIVLGILMLSDNLARFTILMYQLFGTVPYEGLLEYM